MTVEQAYAFFEPVPVVAKKPADAAQCRPRLYHPRPVGDDALGRRGAAWKLALELSKRDTGRTLYILDEPTTGLHFHDIDLLLTVLHRLRDHGNTVVVIEHNLDVIKTADWVVDLGPEGGDGGGRIIVEGTPEVISANKFSHTGRYLREALATRAPARTAKRA